MAAEVPVSDVLCEAMEYLCKLGSNLRNRSESLKEKKIRRDKLKNTHAVKKAASKVLMICELSKKSIENVETGVRKVLSLVDITQAPTTSNGGKANSTKIDHNRDKNKADYYCFEYKSRTLRIAKKVSLKHYRSVKVTAESMSPSMLEKYPVYYNCKLFRQRKKISTKNERIEKNNSNNNSIKKIKNVSLNQDQLGTGDVGKSDNGQHTDNCIEEIDPRSTVETHNVIKPNTDKNEPTDDENELPEKKCGTKTDDEQISYKEKKLSECVEISDDDSLPDKTSNSDEQDLNEKDYKHNRRKKVKKVRFADDSSENETQEPNPIQDKAKSSLPELMETENNAEDEPESKKSDSDNNSDSKKTDDEQLDENSKPLIRCVNISKLLKPEVLPKVQDKTPNISKSDKFNSKEKSKQVDKIRKRCDSSSDEEFWKQKRKEVKQFKSKRFCIKVIRLPKLCTNFLVTHNLKKITRKGKVMCEVSCENESTGNNTRIKESDKYKSETTNTESSTENKTTKEFLLKESDSEEEQKRSKIIKDALLNNSDSDSSKKQKKSKKKVKTMVLDDTDSDSESNKQDKDKNATQEVIKKSLLNDSDSDNNKISDSDCKMSNEKEQTKNESIKKSLLDATDSDSNGSVKDTTKTKEKDKIKESNKNDETLKDSDSDNKSDSEKKKSNDKTQKKSLKESLLHESDSDSNNSVIDVPKETEEMNKDTKKSTENDESLKQDSNKKSDSENKKSSKNDMPQKKSNKESLLGESDSDSNKGVKDVPKKTDEIKKALLNNDSDSENNATSRSGKEVVEEIKNALLNDSDDNESVDKPQSPLNTEKENEFDYNDDLNLGSVVDDIINESLVKDTTLPNSDSENNVESNKSNKDETAPEEKIDQNDETNNDSSEKDEAKQDEQNCSKEEPSKEDLSPTKIKKSLLNDSSSSLSDEDTPKKQKVKLSKSKRDSVKKNIKYSSSSDDESKQSGDSSDERRKRSKRNCRKSSSSSDYSKKKSKRKRLAMSSEGEDSESNKTNSRVKKMVRSKNKPSGSSGQSSDNQDASDKDIDGLTNLNTLNKKHRSRESSSNNTSSHKTQKFKPTPTIGEDLLQAQSSSEESDNGDDLEEELPPINLSGPNGDAIDHLAKDDLLVESDSSHSHKDTDEIPTNNDSEEENVKSKRRKANAISSDSEGGSSRRKQEGKVSDFEDSEDESSDAVKRSKRKKEVDSDASAASSEGKKKRRRIKQIASDGSGSESDTENEGRNKHGRKNIRKVMGKNQLEEATKKAAREEKERIARITERQKLYNNLEFDESGKPDEVILDKVVLDFDPETKEPLIQVDRGLVKKLKPHQANGIKFMWNACFESVKRIKKDKGSGCILAHCMGLGKTLQVISLTHTLLIHEALTNVNRVLVVCPLSTVLNWVSEFKMWLKHADSEFEVDVYELSRYKQNSERAFQLQQWFDGGGVCVLGYEMFRNLSADNPKKFKKKMLKSFQESLVDPGPDLVVCDEGHLLKNEKTSLSQSMNRVKTRRRIVLTGTPLQNNLKEYYCMVQFVKPNLLGKYNEYLNRFVNPITNGQYTDSTEHDIRVMKRRSHVLHKMLDGAVQRRDYGVLAPFLPPKHEYVLFITLSEVQIKLYQFYLDNYSRRPLAGKSSGFLFPDFQSLQRIWTHPLVLKYNSERYEIMQQKKREREEEDSEGSLVDFIDDDSTPDESSTEESTDDSSDMSDDSRKKSKKKKSAKKGKNKDSKISTRRGTRANPAEIEEDVPEVSEVVEVKNENPTEWWIKLVEEEELEDMRNSHKLVLLFDILRQCEAIGDKLLVFSQSLYSLDLIEHFLGKVDEATQEGRIDEKLGGHVGSWSPGVDYFRLDGSTSCENRSIWCKNFNREDNPRARLFLISTRAGGLGINLVAANRVVIFDVSWNPSHDVQSIFRVYRFGQKKPCYVYRFLAMGTMEEKIYERQVTKQAISKRVIDEQQIDRHYAENDLAELYKFEARPEAPREIPALPKDRLFAEMLKDHEQQIYKYHEHDSLLENKEEETLSEEERKAAWEDFENEKTRPPPAPFPSTWPMHNGMVPGLLAQQQQQLAYAALAAMLRKDMPNISDNQIRDMLPLIYNSNPGMFGGYDYGLMQKMSEIYKYAQPGMMNPSMMNPMMNSGGASGGMGGTSGLQYEPPWQRQHQQQQQMRLQQLLQQQQNMGAKFYAGGLGSRDPVAMALQQQRAREIMLGGAGRPRGRPPLAPRAPTTHADVVNLDSD